MCRHWVRACAGLGKGFQTAAGSIKPDALGRASSHSGRENTRGGEGRKTSRAYQWENGGQRGIRTLGDIAATHAFQACSFDHSDICPWRAGRYGRVPGWASSFFAESEDFYRYQVSRPVRWSRPCMMLKLCTAWPPAPFPRLSSADIRITRFVRGSVS